MPTRENIRLIARTSLATFTFVVKDMFKLLRHLRTFSQVLEIFIKILQFSILHFQMYINSLNGEYKMLS